RANIGRADISHSCADCFDLRGVTHVPTRRSSDLPQWSRARELRRFDFLLFQDCLLGKQRTTATAALISRAIEGRAYDRKGALWQDRKSTRLNSSHVKISYAVFCLKKKSKITTES